MGAALPETLFWAAACNETASRHIDKAGISLLVSIAEFYQRLIPRIAGTLRRGAKIYAD